MSDDTMEFCLGAGAGAAGDDGTTEEETTDNREVSFSPETIEAQKTTLTEAQRRRLSTISRQYDLGHKGYLDETEQALRKMDSQNLGALTIDKVYNIMQNLQQEQKANSELIETLRRESRRNLKLKKGIIGLCAFTALLAAANIGTSFAAARLAKDTQVSYTTNDLMSTSTNVRIGTTAKQVAITMQPVPEQRRHRILQDSQESFFCTTTAVNGTGCTLVGEINYSDAAALYDQFCPGWESTGACATATSGGVSQLILTCNGKQSVLFGAPTLPAQLPGKPEPDATYIAFPAPYGRFAAQSASVLFGHVLPCIHDYGLGFSCPEPVSPTDDPVCDVFANWEPDQCAGVVDPCGMSETKDPATQFET